jgi:hypothetical protein
VCSTLRTPLLDPTGRYSSRYYQQSTNFSEALKANFLELRQREARRTPLPRTNPRPEVRDAQSDTSGEGGPTGHGVMLKNLAALVGNYIAVGVRLFVLAGAIRDGAQLDGIRAELPMPLRVVRLTVPLPEIEERLRSDPTSGRRDDLREAAAWVAGSVGVGMEDATVSNDRPIREVAAEILEWLGWGDFGAA